MAAPGGPVQARPESGRGPARTVVVAIGVALASLAAALLPLDAVAEAGVPFRNGGVIGFGSAADHGSPTGTSLNSPITAMAASQSGDGYWLTAADGGIFAYGDATFHGSAGAIDLVAPVVAIAASPDGGGYWQLALDGGVFAYGTATFHGSTGGLALNQPVVGMARTPSGHGYWLVAADGGIFAFGDAPFLGSTGGIAVNRRVTGMAATPSGEGYWLVAADGGIFAFGDATFYGSTGGRELDTPVVAMAAAPDGRGYTLAERNGAVYTFGSAVHHGSNESVVPTPPIVGIQSAPDGKGYWLLGNIVFPTSFSHPSGATGTAASIVGIAAGEVGADPYSGRFCNPYGPCVEWCALFATWVWRQAGIGVPAYAFTGNVWSWAAARGMTLPGSARPRPGDLVFYGTGPSTASTSVHMGIVVQVWPNGAIVTVEGDSGPGPVGHHDVIFNGPFMPASAEQYRGFGVYAYARA